MYLDQWQCCIDAVDSAIIKGQGLRLRVEIIDPGGGPNLAPQSQQVPVLHGTTRVGAVAFKTVG